MAIRIVPNRYITFFLFIASLSIFILWFNYNFAITQSVGKNPQISHQKCDLSLLSNASKSCILDYITFHRPAFGNSLGKAIDLCTKVFTSRLTLAHLHNLNDIKEAAKPLHDRHECNVITIGVGDDIEAEKQLRRRVPSCRFYGADPVEESGQIYKQIGHFVHTAINDVAGSIDAQVLATKGQYVDRVVEAITLIDFLKSIKVSTIDYMFMDAEGAEYRLLPYIIEKEEFSNGEIKICQIAVEVHGELKKYGMSQEKFEQWIGHLLVNGTFVPVWQRYYLHMSLFLINTSDQYCVDKFFDIVCSDDVVDEWRQTTKPKMKRWTRLVV